MIKKILIISMFFITIIITAYVNTPKYEIIPTMSVPVLNKTIVLDAGHGTPDEGAQNNEGMTEAKVNLEIVYKTKKLLEECGAKVILTRSDENAIYDGNAKTIGQKKVSDIKNRVKIGNESSADIFVSIHLNKISDTRCKGWQTFYNIRNENSKKLATSIQDSLNDTIKIENKRKPQKLTDVYIMKNVEIPITIVECGFLSNKEDANLLKTNEYQEKLAWGIYGGIMKYFED